MKALFSYLPQDRLRALARGERLPDCAGGAALFADISGFTSLTEALTHSLGSRAGSETLTNQINAVYDALTAVVARWRGSVIGFSGDAITCWFDDADGPAPPRAAACALALQAAMAPFAAIPLPGGRTTALALKVAVASGSARRFVVGNPELQQLDVLAGATLVRMAMGEHLARPGEVLLDAATVAALEAGATLGERRLDPASGDHFTLLHALPLPPAVAAWEPEELPAEALRPWVLPVVYEREQAGLGAFLTELRPAVTLFLRFGGLDFDGEERAGAQLDNLIRRVQLVLAEVGGTLLQLTVGDKGAYLYAAFGAPIAYEDDARRAVRAALALHAATAELGLPPVQIGLSQGTLRCGAYGGTSRCTYGALGDDVNLAARLMQLALPGETLLSGRVQQALGDTFSVEPRPPLALKGKVEPLPVFALTGRRQQRALRLQEPSYALPMVGRQAELALIGAKLELALLGQGQIVGITAEAGMGKSRLVAEVIRLARRSGFVGYGGACQSDGLHTPYLVWRPIWSAFFGLDLDLTERRLLRTLEGELEDRAPERLDALPLLSGLLGLTLPDNDFTRGLEPKERKSALHALLEACLTSAAREQPLLLVLEDAHWLDALSHDLLDELARASAALPVLIVLTYRPPELVRLQTPRVEALPHYTRIILEELTVAEAEQAIRARLAQLYPARGGGVPSALVEQLMARSQGNPFYLEELLNYLHDRGLDPRDPTALTQIALPDSLHALILSRIDQLSGREQTTLKVASIVGRVFQAAWLAGYYPALGEQATMRADLDALADLELTPLYSEEPELAYLFKHIVTHEVAYESLPEATRASLHEKLAIYLERSYAEAPPLDVLAYHYGRSANQAKQREYFAQAGEAAQAAYANEAALAYYAQLLPLLEEVGARVELHLRRGAVLELIGSWEEAEAEYHAALALAEQITMPPTIAQSEHALGRLCGVRGEYGTALEWLGRARSGWAALHDVEGQAQALTEMGVVYWRQGEYAQARMHLEEGLALARTQGARSTAARALNNLGNVVAEQGDDAAARGLYHESLVLRRAIGDKQAIAMTLNNLGVVAEHQGDDAAARALYDESLVLYRAIADKWGIAMALNNLGLVVSEQGDYATARALQEESLVLRRGIGDKQGIAMALENLGNMAVEHGDSPTARTHYAESLQLAQEIGDKQYCVYDLNGLAAASDQPLRSARLAAAAETLRKVIDLAWEPVERRIYERTVAAARAALSEAAFAAAWAEGQAMTLEEAVAYALPSAA